MAVFIMPGFFVLSISKEVKHFSVVQALQALNLNWVSLNTTPSEADHLHINNFIWVNMVPYIYALPSNRRMWP